MKKVWDEFELLSRSLEKSKALADVFFNPKQAPLVVCLRQQLWPASLGRFSYKRSSEQTALPRYHGQGHQLQAGEVPEELGGRALPASARLGAHPSPHLAGT